MFVTSAFSFRARIFAAPLSASRYLLAASV